MSIREGIQVVEKKHIPYGPEWMMALDDDFHLSPDFSEKEWTKSFQSK